MHAVDIPCALGFMMSSVPMTAPAVAGVVGVTVAPGAGEPSGPVVAVAAATTWSIRVLAWRLTTACLNADVACVRCPPQTGGRSARTVFSVIVASACGWRPTRRQSLCSNIETLFNTPVLTPLSRNC